MAAYDNVVAEIHDRYGVMRIERELDDDVIGGYSISIMDEFGDGGAIYVTAADLQSLLFDIKHELGSL